MWVDDGHDRRRRRGPDQREPATVEEGLELTEVDTEPDQGPQRGETDDVQQEWGCPPPATPEPGPTRKPEPVMAGPPRTVLIARRPQKGERGPTKQPRSARVCSVVYPGRVHAGHVQERHGHRRCHGAKDHDGQHAPSPEARRPDTEPEGENRRPDQVELLFDGERPQML